MKALNSCLSYLHTKKNQTEHHQLLITSYFIFIFISHQLHQMMASESQVPAKPESGSRKAGHLRPPEQNPKCPRCDSPNTKFCYYNNYSLSQPRHFCKTCRRYWTRGGALRNIPIGGGCRKNKKIKSNSRLSYDPKLSNNPSLEFHPLGGGAIQDIGTSSIITTTNNPSLNLNPTCYNMDTSVAGSSSLMGFNNYYGNSVLQQSGETGSLINAGAHQEMASMNFNTNNLASSIESLSCFNQDLHWKLQQQRINSLLLHEENQKEPSALFENQLVRKLDPISFVGNTTSTNQWVFDNSFNPTTNTLSITPITTNNNINYSGSGGGNTNNNWSGIQGWSSTDQWNQFSGTGLN